MRLLVVVELLLAAASAAPGADYTVRDNTKGEGYTVRDNTPRAKGCVCDSCKCAPGTCPGKCPVVMEVEATPAGEVMSWTDATGASHRATLPPGVRATEAIGSAMVKSDLCRAGKCPLTAPAVRLVPRAAKKTD